MSEQWMSISEYARIYSLSDMTVRRRIKTGRLHAVLREGKYYIPQKSEPLNEAPTPQIFTGARTMQPGPSYHAPEPRPQTLEPSLYSTKAVNPNWNELSLEINQLTKFCEAALRNFDDTKKELSLRYQAELAALNAKLTNRDFEISRLKQEMADLKALLEKINQYKAA